MVAADCSLVSARVRLWGRVLGLALGLALGWAPAMAMQQALGRLLATSLHETGKKCMVMWRHPGSCPYWATRVGSWTGRLQALEKLPGSCPHRATRVGSWMGRLQALEMLLGSRLCRVRKLGNLTGRLRAPGKLRASLQDTTTMVSRIGQLGKLPAIRQRVHLVCRADPQERLPATLVSERRKMRRVGQRAMLPVSPLKAVMAAAMWKLQQARRHASACSSTERPWACACR